MLKNLIKQEREWIANKQDVFSGRKAKEYIFVLDKLEEMQDADILKDATELSINGSDFDWEEDYYYETSVITMYVQDEYIEFCINQENDETMGDVLRIDENGCYHEFVEGYDWNIVKGFIFKANTVEELSALRTQWLDNK
jgi:ATP-dependent protease HslVU (ClpYQ) peptidase subunit